MDKFYIERSVSDLHAQIWKNRRYLWPTMEPPPIDMLCPEVAARVLGVEYVQEEALGCFGDRRHRYEVAGLIDRQKRRIAVSNKFPSEVNRFTGAHEVGHWLLHPGEIMHRDRPIKGASIATEARTPQEREADYFAACFLVPEKLLRKYVEDTFQIDLPFVLDEEAAFWLCPDEPDSIWRPIHESLEPALAVASCESYRGRHFPSLAKRFRVSTTTMAIRLMELGLLES